MADLFIKSAIAKWVPDALPAANSFAGKKIVVTGGTSGLGIASAAHFLNLGAKEVIITARSTQRGDDARRKILAGAQQMPADAPGTITVMELDMNSFDSCVSFARKLKQQYGRNHDGDSHGLDVVVFNAGMTNSKFVRSQEGM